MSVRKRCDIIIPVWNQLDHTRTCIDKIIENTPYPYRLILIDNGSDLATRDYLKAVAAGRGTDVILIRNEENLGFVKAVNQGLKASNGSYVCVMNNDTIPTPGWLENLVEFAESHEDVGLMNPLCDGPSEIPIDEYARSLAKNKTRYMEVNQCFGFCMLIKREVIDKIGYLDESFGMGCYDDTDYSMRAGRAGYRCVCVHSSYVHHVHGISFKALGNREGIVTECEKEYFKKWPRHRRTAIGFLLKDETRDSELENLLRGMLFLAREWYWINLWVFGDTGKGKARIDAVKERIGMPLHQNIKYNFFPPRFKNLQVLVRLVERSFGTKSRKRYDMVFVDDERLLSLINLFHPLIRMKASFLKYDNDVRGSLDKVVSGMRER